MSNDPCVPHAPNWQPNKQAPFRVDETTPGGDAQQVSFVCCTAGETWHALTRYADHA